MVVVRAKLWARDLGGGGGVANSSKRGRTEEGKYRQ